MVTPDGWRVEQILVQRHLSRPPTADAAGPEGQLPDADCASVAEVARHIDLAQLIPEQRAKAR